MKNVCLFLTAFLWLSAPAVSHAQDKCGAFDPSWQSCAADADCAIGHDVCGAPAAYNKDSLEAANKYASCRMPMVDCAVSKTPNGGAAVCVKGACAIAPAVK